MFGRRNRQTDDEIGAALREAREWLADFEGSGRVADLDAAIAAGDHALSLCAPDAPERFAVLLLLGQARALRSEAADSHQDLADAVETYRELRRLAPTEQPDTTGFVLRAFAGLSLRLGLLTGAQRPVEEAALASREMDQLALSTGHAELHSAAAEMLRHVLFVLPPDHPDRAALSAVRGAALIRWTRRTGDPSRLDEATEEVEGAVRRCPAGDPNRPPFLALLSDVRQLRYERDGTREALDAMLAVSREVLDLYPAGHAVSTAMLRNLGLLHRDRYGLTGEVADLDAAAHYLRLAADRTADPAERAAVEDVLAEVVGLHGPLPEVRVPPGLTFVAGPGTTPRRPPAEVGDDLDELARHGAALSDLLGEYERIGDAALLERIADDGRQLLARLRPGHPGRWLVGAPLGPALMRRFETLGEAADLDEAVELLREVLARPLFSPADGTDDLTNLAAALINRFLRDRTGADLDEAIAHCRRAVELTEPTERTHARYLLTLGTALVYRYEHSGRRFDLDEAIAVGQRALTAARTPGDATVARANLGNRLRQRFLAGRDPADIQAAVAHLRAALAAEDDPPVRLNLALSLRNLGAGPGGEDDLHDAVEQFRAVLDMAPRRSPIHLTALLGLAQALGDLGRIGEAVAVLDGVAESGAGRSFERMDALTTLAGLRAELAAEGRGDWRDAARAYADAVQQLHLTVWRGLGATDRDRLVTRWPTVACDAAAAAVAAGLPQQAVELLDHGRSLWWGQLLDTRSDLSALRQAHPDLAERLTELRAESDRLAGSDEPGAAGRRRRLALDWDHAVAAVRARPGFARFLLPTPFAELAAAAADGPVVLVNVSRHRCDALVLTGGGVRVVPLPDLTAEEAGERTHRYLDVVARVGTGGASSGPREQVLLAYLEWLWDVVAAPVLAAVPAPAGARMWWCPTGPLALAPLHAAGYHDPDDAPAGRSVLDHVVSSTTPTLRALRHARRPSAARAHRLLVAAYDERPHYVTGLPDLPSAAREARLLRSRFPDATTLTAAAASRAGVMAALTGHSCAHFACHGEPGAGGRAALFLADAPLTMADIAQLDLDGAHLAVLSACHTAMGTADLPDEAGHLAAALQVAGFRQVVSTLWAIADDTAVAVAEGLYDGLAGPDGAVDPARAAGALHRVVGRLRQQNPYEPSRWAPFVHHGR
ncbi:CHAT domain-containing protein [Micromonospora olivasterospora]|uniref:CHAT domain-containing protein n=1 Tax=Micromonospora olivasterospora TaxID=1880 RepID=A0A562IHG7_MICOL|nr:CHAT domain-containing protein [Micromonospora olivasterospora]TWH70183.1 CHAT domain-containing protein [Micromonospora olivasterospora]